MRKKHLPGIPAGLVAMALMTTAAHAQSLPRLSVPDPNQILAPPAATLPVNPAPSLPGHTPAAAPNEGHFRFTQVHVTGAAHVSEAQIAALFDGLKGRAVSGAELSPVLDQVNALYAKAGYPLGRAFVPAQTIKNGVLTLHMVEGYVETIAVTADSEKLRALVARLAEPVTREKPLTKAALERTILLIQDIPGITLGSKFEDMNPATGGTRLVLEAKVQWATVELSMDNRANLPDLPLLPYAVGTFNDLLGWGDRLTVTALLSPRQKDYAYYGVGFSSPVGDDGLILGLDGGWAQTLDSVSLRPFNIHAHSQRLAANGAYPVIRSKDENLNLRSSLYYEDAAYKLANSIFGDFAHDKNLALQLGGDYSRSLSPDLGIGGDLFLTQGIDGFTPEPHTRLHTIPGFTKFRGDVRLAWQPITDVLLRLSATGQYSADSLIASEAVTFGGTSYGRGFDTAEITGNNGIGFSVQPEYRIGLDSGWSVTPYPLFDYAKTYNRAVDLLPNGELVSAGVGARLSQDALGSLTVELAKPLNRAPFERGNRDWRAFVGVDLGVDSALSLIG
jgi:hemolysin activation/secretion protein